MVLSPWHASMNHLCCTLSSLQFSGSSSAWATRSLRPPASGIDPSSMNPFSCSVAKSIASFSTISPSFSREAICSEEPEEQRCGMEIVLQLRVYVVQRCMKTTQNVCNVAFEVKTKQDYT